MITCPWCGTNYETFLSNCRNCGGPISIPSMDGAAGPQGVLPPGRLQLPPPPPRPIANRYVWRLLASDGWAIAAFVLLLLGLIFSLVGMGLTAGIVTAFVGIPFTGLGSLLLGAGLIMGGWRYADAQQVVEVLRVGEAVEGQITQVEENLHVRVDMRHPWLIRYQFRRDGQVYAGQVSTLNPPGAALQPGQPAYVLYLPKSPQRNVLYPHP
jgi:hypothetical protein